MYDVRNWHWVVADDPTRRWSSAARAYVERTDAAYLDWVERLNRAPTRIDNELLLVDVLRKAGADPGELAINATGADIVATLLSIDSGAIAKAFAPDDPTAAAASMAANDPRIIAAAAAIDFRLR